MLGEGLVAKLGLNACPVQSPKRSGVQQMLPVTELQLLDMKDEEGRAVSGHFISKILGTPSFYFLVLKPGMPLRALLPSSPPGEELFFCSLPLGLEEGGRPPCHVWLHSGHQVLFGALA